MEEIDIHLHEFLDQPAEQVKSHSPESEAETGNSRLPESDAHSTTPKPSKGDAEAVKVIQSEVKPKPQKPAKQASTELKRVLLSKLLKNVPAGECIHIFLDWDAAIVEEKIRAVPLKDRQLTKQIIDLNGKEKVIEQPDELIEVTPTFQAWFADQREKSRYATLAHVGEIAITSTSKQGDFDLLLQARVRRLKAKKTKAKAGDR